MPRTTKRILIGSAAIILFLFVILVVHIILVTKPGKGHHADLQLARIDFPDTLSVEEQALAVKTIRSVDGVGIAKINAAGTTLVYSYPTGTLKSEEVYQEFDAAVSFAAQRYVAPEMADVKGCPVMDKSSMAYRFSTFIKNTFH